MSFHSIPVWAITAMLLAGPALASHCDAEMAEALASHATNEQRRLLACSALYCQGFSRHMFQS